MDSRLLYVLDSIRGRPLQPIVDVILKHLRFEAFAWEDKKIDEARIISRKPPVSVYLFPLFPINGASQVPVQRNGCDCGYYMIHFFDLILSNPTQYRKILKVSSVLDILKCLSDETLRKEMIPLHTEIGKVIVPVTCEKKSRASLSQPQNIGFSMFLPPCNYIHYVLNSHQFHPVNVQCAWLENKVFRCQ